MRSIPTVGAALFSTSSLDCTPLHRNPFFYLSIAVVVLHSMSFRTKDKICLAIWIYLSDMGVRVQRADDHLIDSRVDDDF
jgi:hypothetical protein